MAKKPSKGGIERVADSSPDFREELIGRLRDAVPEAFADGKLDLEKLGQLTGMLRNVQRGSTVSTDELMSYGLLAGDGYAHGTVKHGQKEWARYDYRQDALHHVNNVEAFWRLFKKSVASTHIHISAKARLLSFDEPASFIFSHSALREGWDNPNVFQICSMREVGSDTERRQQVGRGVRLPVNQAGERIRDERINVLTVVASETYERFVAELQGEIEFEYGESGTPPKPANARKRATMRLRKAHMLKPEFKELWNRIKHKTRYAVTIDSEKLINDVLPELDVAEIRKPRVVISKAEVIANDKDTFEAFTQSGARTAIDLAGRYPLPNLIGIMENLMEHTSPPMRVSRRTLLEIYRRTGNRQAALENPHEFATVAVGIIKNKLTDQLVDGIRYEKIGEWYEMSQFEPEIETWADYIVPSVEANGAGGTHLYDGVPFDSETIEKPFIETLEKRKDVRLYIKLPSWFTVATPIGEYNPDWAVVMEDPEGGDDLLYLVRETKGTLNLDELRPDEKRKILCGRRHFADALDVNYRVVSSAAQLPSEGV